MTTRASDPRQRIDRWSMMTAALVCALAGVVTVTATLAVARRAAPGSSDVAAAVATEEYGRRLIAHTASLIGPDQPDAAMRYSGTRMACASCHLGSGMEPGTLSLLQAAANYPRFSGRDGGVRDLFDRINGCMTRSMNGRELPRDSPEMIAMAAYIRSLGDLYAAMGEGRRASDEQPPFATPNRAANLQDGRTVFVERCAICHGEDGAGLPATTNRADGYVFPPLWGPDSFNNGAGMHRVLTAARFIKAKMPLGEANLSDGEAFDVAAYINSQPRPQMANLDRDYPDRSTKPIDGAYGPFADDFPLEQHRFGPFQPIEDYYKALKASKQ